MMYMIDEIRFWETVVTFVYYDLVDNTQHTRNDRNAKKLILYEATTDADNFCTSSTSYIQYGN